MWHQPCEGPAQCPCALRAGGRVTCPRSVPVPWSAQADSESLQDLAPCFPSLSTFPCLSEASAVALRYFFSQRFLVFNEP